MVIDLIGESSRDVIGLLSVKLLSPHSVHSDDHTQPTYDFDWFFNFSRDVWRLCEDLGIKRLNKPGECKFYKLSSQKCQPGIFQKHCYYETYNNQRNSWLEVCHLFEILVLAVCGFVHKSSTLGARDFSCAVSGFGQVLKSDPASPLVSSAFGRTRVGPRPTKRSSPSHARKNLRVLGYKPSKQTSVQTLREKGWQNSDFRLARGIVTQWKYVILIIKFVLLTAALCSGLLGKEYTH